MFNKKILIVLLSLIFLIAGCTSGNTPTSEGKQIFTDSMGNELELEKTPEKVISLSPAITEILYALDLGDKIVGTTDYCDYPEEAKNTPKMGGFNTPNLELIVDSQPDLVFISSGVQAELSNKFKELGIKTFALDAKTVDQVIENIKTMGKLMDAQEKAEEIASDMEKRRDAVKKAVEGLEKPLVFFEIWNEPLLSAGPETFISNILDIAGGINFAEDCETDYPQISLEVLLDRDPDFYIAIDHRKNTDISTRPGFESLKALQNNQYYKIEDDYVTLPGPRIIQGLERVAEIIHPEAFK